MYTDPEWFQSDRAFRQFEYDEMVEERIYRAINPLPNYNLREELLISILTYEIIGVILYIIFTL